MDAQLANKFFPDSIQDFELATGTDPAAVPDAVAADAWHQPTTRQDRKASRWPPHWKAESGCLVIDNWQHVLDGVADLVEAVITQYPLPWRSSGADR